MYTGLFHTHSAFRWIVLALIAIAGLKSLIGWLSKSEYAKADDKLSLFALIFTHIQLLVGFILYFVSPKVTFDMTKAISRYYSVEHITIMLLVGVLITMGRSKTKKKVEAIDKFKTTAIFNLTSLVLILVAIYVMHP